MKADNTVKSEFSVQDKKKATVCVVLIFICTLVSVGFMLFTVFGAGSVENKLLMTLFISVYSGVLVVLCPCVIVCVRIMKRSKSAQPEQENSEV